MTAPRVHYDCVRSYIRVSSDKQATRGTSLDGQRDAHIEYCVAHRLPEPIFYVEVESASDLAIEKRDEQLRIQREATPRTLILVTVLDRWSRDVPHAVSTVRALIKRDVGVILFQDGIDASTREGDWMLVQRAAMAEQERMRLIERTVVRRRQLNDAGLYVYGGKLPLGLRVEKRRIFVVPEEAALDLSIFERCAKGESMSEIAPTLPPARNRTTWNVHAVHRVLHSRYLLGEVRRSDGEWVAGTHDAIVSRDLWDRAHKALRERVAGGRRYSQGESAQRLLRGLVKCAACGRKVSVRFGSPVGRQHPDPDGKRVHYYVCRGVLMGKGCSEGWIRAYDIDAAAEEQIIERLAELREELAQPTTAQPRERKAEDPAKALAKIAERKARAIDLASDGTMSREDLRAAIARYEEEAAAIRLRAEREVEQAKREAQAADPARRAHLLAEVKHIRAAWANMDVAARQEVVTILAAAVHVGRSGVRFTWRSAADLASEVAEPHVVTQP